VIRAIAAFAVLLLKRRYMTISIDIMSLRPFTQADVWPILTGYETREIYQVKKTETDSLTRFDFLLVQLEQPFHDDFYNDFTAEEIQIWNRLLPQGYSFGAYQAGELVGLAVSEVWPDERRARVWEFHVRAECRRMGIGRALMERVLDRARQDHLGLVMLETQNTNVNAIRFYRRIGFSLEAIDIGHYYPTSNPVVRQQVQFLMKRWLE
jgi:streptothricin acetyltransferase